MTQPLHKLKPVNLRTRWAKEDKNFTKWLSEDENLELLGETIGMDLKLEKTEAKVGSLSLDILCKNTKDKSWVAIENQLEKTDHTHLGQVITYAAGLKTETMIWIASDFTEEHRQALKWLNKNTDDKFRFFGIEIKLYSVANDHLAVDFNIVCKPTDWRKPKSRRVHKTKNSVPNSLQIMQRRYWQTLVDYLRVHGFKLDTPTPYGQSWIQFSINISGVKIGAIMDTKKKTIGVELCMENPKTSKRFFGILKKQKAQIEKEIGAKLVWRNKSTNISTKIILFKDADPKDENDWLDQCDWFKETIEKFHRVLTGRVGIIDL